MAQIEWGEPVVNDRRQTTIRARIGELSVGQVWQSRDGGWYVNAYLAPLPDRLDRLTDTTKATERAAKACLQRIVNEFTKLLGGET